MPSGFGVDSHANPCRMDGASSHCAANVRRVWSATYLAGGIDPMSWVAQG